MLTQPVKDLSGASSVVDPDRLSSTPRVSDVVDQSEKIFYPVLNPAQNKALRSWTDSSYDMGWRSGFGLSCLMWVVGMVVGWALAKIVGWPFQH
jgi:hypothetical protein